MESVIHWWSRMRQRSAQVSSLALLIQRSPMLKVLLPEARVISTSGFSEALKFIATALTGLTAYDSVTGATTLAQLAPAPGSLNIPATGGTTLNFIYQCLVDGGYIPGGFEITTGTLPTGLAQTNLKNSTVDSITGTPTQSGSFPVKITAWEFPNYTGRSMATNFTITVAAPPVPAISAQPTGGNFAVGSLAALTVTQTSGYAFIWKKDGTALTASESVLFSRTAPRKYFFPSSDPGTAWRSGAAFDDSAWLAVSGGIGYDNSPGPVNYAPFIATGGNVQSQMAGTGKPTSAFVRMPFDLTAPGNFSYMKLKVQCDDGFVLYLNGTEIMSQNKPGGTNLTWQSAATAAYPDADAVLFREVDLSRHLTLLRAGTNLLAAQMLNEATETSDCLFNCEVVAGMNATNSSRLVLAGLQPAQSGSYTVAITNTAGTATSNAAAVNIMPAITQQPSSTSVNSGAAANLGAGATGTAPLTWQWYEGSAGDLTKPVAGATTSSFTTPSLTATKSYWARVSNMAGTADTSAATVTVSSTIGTFSSWQSSKFTAAQLADTSVSGPAADPDHDLLSNSDEYLFGTSPLAADFNSAGLITPAWPGPTLSYFARKAEGTGYEGLKRYYLVETTDSLSSNSWVAATGSVEVDGNNQPVSFPSQQTGKRVFFRLRVRLAP